jgi:hypothetical protein
MSDLHIDDFCRDVALALTHLYLAFPRKQILYVEDLLGPVETDEFGLPTTRFQACFSTLVWLGEEGWLRFEAPIRQEALDQAVLTQRAFLLLTSAAAEPAAQADAALPPSVVAAENSRIARLRRALRHGSSIELGNVVRELLGAGQ